MLSNPRQLVNSIIPAPISNYLDRSFFLEQLLGQGSEGCVYLGRAQNWNNQRNNKIAIKLQPNMKQDEVPFIQSLIQTQNSYEFTNNPTQLSLIQQTSTNIIRIYEIFKWNDINVILMEAGQQNLNDYLHSQQNLPLMNKLQIMKQIATAIQFLHLTGLIHRDIKPENFIQVNTQFKLIDFGLIRKNNNDRVKTTKIGTPLFSSPEIFEESDTYTQSVDIWSLACVFYEIIEQQSLIQGNTIEDVRRFVINHKYQPDQIYNKIDIIQMSNQLKILLKQMLAPIPENRCSIEVIINQLTNIIEQEKSIKIDNRMIEKKDNQQQQQQFRNFSPIPQNKTDQNFFVLQNQIPPNLQTSIQKNQSLPINNSQIDQQNQLKSGIFQIQQILQNQVKQAQEQNRDLLDQLKSLTQQNSNLMEQTQKNIQQIEYLQKKLIDKEKEDSRQKNSSSSKQQCNCDLEIKQQLTELQRYIEKEKQSNPEQVSKIYSIQNQLYQSISHIAKNLEEMKKQHNDQSLNISNNQQQQFSSIQNNFSGQIDQFNNKIHQSISELKEMIQSYQLENKKKVSIQNDEFKVTDANQNQNNQYIITEINTCSSQLNKKLADYLFKQTNIIIQELKKEIIKNDEFKVTDASQNQNNQYIITEINTYSSHLNKKLADYLLQQTNIIIQESKKEIIKNVEDCLKTIRNTNANVERIQDHMKQQNNYNQATQQQCCNQQEHQFYQKQPQQQQQQQQEQQQQTRFLKHQQNQFYNNQPNEQQQNQLNQQQQEYQRIQQQQVNQKSTKQEKYYINK